MKKTSKGRKRRENITISCGTDGEGGEKGRKSRGKEGRRRMKK